MSATRNRTEEQMVHLVRNALLVAGHEMGGLQGDHWPVIKSTITDVMNDWEQLQIERDVHREMKNHLETVITEMERRLPTCSAKIQREVGPKVQALREIYEACFIAVDESRMDIDDEEKPAHVKRAEYIIGGLTEEADD